MVGGDRSKWRTTRLEFRLLTKLKPLRRAQTQCCDTEHLYCSCFADFFHVLISPELFWKCGITLSDNISTKQVAVHRAKPLPQAFTP